MQEPAKAVGLSGARLVAGILIGWERFWPLILPLLLVISGFLIVSWFGLWAALPNLLRIAFIVLLGLAAVASLWPLRHFRFALSTDIDTRIEQRSGLQHRPVTAQTDILAAGESRLSQALWQEHRTRMNQKLVGLKTGVAETRISKKDPYGLRAVVLLVLFVAFGFAGGNQQSLILDAFRPNNAIAALFTRLDIWVSPPAYTNKPPLFLKRAGKDLAMQGAVSVPEGSQLVIRLLGNKTPSLAYITANGTKNMTPVDNQSDNSKNPGEIEYRFVLEKSGLARLSQDDLMLGEWQFDVLPDNDPVIRFDAPPKRGKGRMLELAFSVKDDYGVTSAVAEIRLPLANDPDARPLVEPPDINLALRRSQAREGKIKLSRDLSQHPFAGGTVLVTLMARDGAGQTGKSRTLETVLPMRFFTKPLAIALVEQRRDLAGDARNARQVASMLDIIANTAPEAFIPEYGTYLGLQVIYRHIARAKTDDELREGLDLMWELALAIEDGDLSDAAARLREAQEALKKAIEEGASEEEISRLMKDLRQAMNTYLEEMTRQMARNQQNQNLAQNQNSQSLRKQDLDRMMDRIENLAKSGSKDAAQQLLSELQQMMDQLQAGRHQQQRQQEGDEFNREMNNLAEMMQKQQQLMDKTFRMQNLQQQQQQGNSQQNQQQQGNQQQQQRQGQQNQQSEMTPQDYADAMKQLQQQQGALKEQLQEMMRSLEQMGVDPGKDLGQAGEAMGKAQQSLGKGENGEAMGQQGKALNALRRGAQSMMQQMQQNMAGERGGTDQNGQQRNDNARNDPLGRQQRTRGPNLGNDVKVPDEIDAQTAREILEAIRRKLANPTLPKIEFNYLDRLLKPQ